VILGHNWPADLIPLNLTSQPTLAVFHPVSPVLPASHRTTDQHSGNLSEWSYYSQLFFFLIPKLIKQSFFQMCNILQLRYLYLKRVSKCSETMFFKCIISISPSNAAKRNNICSIVQKKKLRTTVVKEFA
jgi:hypothetical protein